MSTQASAPQGSVPVDTADSRTVSEAPRTGDPADSALVLDELLIEDVSIDGMCGVY
jgi:mycofactocin precursor